MRKYSLIYPLLIMGVLLILAISCKKDDPILKKNVTITWANPADITVGTLLSTTQLNATADVTGTFVYSPAIGASLAVGANQDLKVDFTPTDAVNYNTATKTVTINVIAKKDPIVTWANPADITVGTQLSVTQLNATTDVPGTFIYTPTFGASLAIGANQVLKVDFAPADSVNYNSATKTVTINVIANRNPIVTWANPTDITVGTMLSAIQLNATANVPGTFVYTPAIGASLAVGANQDLKVDFTPTDAINYNTATKTVTINVIANTFTDPRDGNTYQLVTIGKQIWMVENLRYLPSVVGPSTSSQTAPYYYVNGYYGTSVTDAKATANYTTFGVLYNWPAAMNGAASSSSSPSGVQGICPSGWHLPSNAEWEQMENYLSENGYNYDGTTGGGPTKIAKSLASTSGWTISSTVGAVGNTDYPTYRNKSGFTALHGGYCIDEFYGIGFGGFWWSATEYNATYAWYRGLYYDYAGLDSDYGSKRVGYYIRCLRD